MRKKQIKDPDIALRNITLSPVTSLLASFRMYSFDYSLCSLSATLYPGVSADKVTTPSIGGMTAGRQVVNSAKKDMLLVGRHRLKAMQ